ncbi:MAG TPA: MOSC domain-containing protein [Candidatus Aminicenantes bacterium]|nr:MOSC domain-containing protein [Candidatus Aminicenantes bacterium]HRY64614.1 MOSC domain-containing protein [Candidatus Aminicenantes bacterium]HRZ71527.1 MOSC domain-containing protein [Candidatus Aminicenantes bacterium]
MSPAAGGTAGTVVSVNASLKKGQIKRPVAAAVAQAGRGLEGDAHRDFGHRQVSLLAIEDIEAQKERAGAGAGAAAGVEIGPGAFAENLTTRGLDLAALRVGDELVVAGTVRLRVSQIGKDCHTHCAVYHLIGDCIMPARGIFCEVLSGGTIRPGDAIERA